MNRPESVSLLLEHGRRGREGFKWIALAGKLILPENYCHQKMEL